MKKSAVLGLSLVLALSALAACKKGPSFPVAGSAKAEDMLTLIPSDVQGVFVINAGRIMSADVVDKAIKDNKEYQKYKETIDAIGLDPQKDIFFAAVGISQKPGQTSTSGVGVINLKYDQAKIVAKVKEQSPEYTESAYEGVTLFTVPEKEGETPMFGAFLDASNIALGQEATVKAAVDVFKGKAESVVKNAGIMDLVKTANKTAMVWSVFAFSPDQVKQMTGGNPMLGSLESLKAMSMFVDYANKKLDLEIKAMTTDAAKNKDIADFLNGLKAMGSMAAGEKPEIGEILNAITVSSAPDHVKIAASMSEELITKLSAEAQKQAAATLAGETPVEKKEEPKPKEKIKI
ncbi:MAG: hypothetical protein FJY80_00985 [Candidatus Aminicenantes bacterium]|nr:hypothetical protein [Candidatus Aminicenantes bacterium]